MTDTVSTSCAIGPIGRPRRTTVSRSVRATIALVVAAGCLSACATASTGSDASGSTDLGSCGTVPTVAAKGDADLVGSLPAAQQADYNGLSTPVAASAWASWKPNHPAPYTVAIAWQPPFNSFQTDTLAGMTKTFEASGKVDVIANVATTSLTDVPGQLQQFNQLVARKPDLIVLEPLSATPFVAAVASAKAAGIPVVSAWNLIDSADAISVGQNNFLLAATLAAKVVTKMGGKGEVLKVHGIPGIAQDTDAEAGFDAVLANCPNVKVAGEVTGNYSPSDTKAATLQFLATHPGVIGGVLQAGTMTTGVINAFEQLGRPVPAIADLGSSKGAIAYAHDHASTYEEFGSAGADAAIGATFAGVALRTLEGEGPKLAQIVTQPQLITAENLDTVYQDGWTLDTAGNAAAPDDPFMTADTMASFFSAAS